MEAVLEKSIILSLKCPRCDLVTLKMSIFFDHLKSHKEPLHVNIYRCNQCCRISNLLDLMQEHIFDHDTKTASIDTEFKIITNPTLPVVHTDPEECLFCPGNELGASSISAHYAAVHNIADINAYFIWHRPGALIQQSVNTVSSTVMIVKQERNELTACPSKQSNNACRSEDRFKHSHRDDEDIVEICSIMPHLEAAYQTSQLHSTRSLPSAIESEHLSSSSPHEVGMLSPSPQSPYSQPLEAPADPEELVSTHNLTIVSSNRSQVEIRDPIVSILKSNPSPSTSSMTQTQENESVQTDSSKGSRSRRYPIRKSRGRPTKRGRSKRTSIESDSEVDYLSSASPQSSCPSSPSPKPKQARGSKKAGAKQTRAERLGEDRPLAAAAASRVARRNRNLVAPQPVAPVAPVAPPPQQPRPAAAAAQDVPEPVKCDECERTFKTAGAMRIHSSLTHWHANNPPPGGVAPSGSSVIEPQFQCPSCWRRFMRRSGVEAHLERAHNVPPDEAQRITDGIADKVYNRGEHSRQ